MKKIINATKSDMPAIPQHRSFRRYIRKLFASFIQHQGHGHQKEFLKLMEKMREIEGSIETIVREMERQVKRWK